VGLDNYNQIGYVNCADAIINYGGIY